MQSYETDRGRVAELFHALEAAKKKGVLQSYSLSQTTLEQVFLNVAKGAAKAAAVQAPWGS